MAFVDDGGGQTEESSWWDYANCLGVDPDLFFPERAPALKKPKRFAEAALFAKIAWNTP